jgi:import inner membrane translocase subunit TIM9
MDFSNFNAAEQAHMTKIIEKKQVRKCILVLGSLIYASIQMQDFLKLYSGLVERCFNSCVNDFTSKSLGTKEVSFGGISVILLLPSIS